jgi:hypothetical protein
LLASLLANGNDETFRMFADRGKRLSTYAEYMTEQMQSPAESLLIPDTATREAVRDFILRIPTVKEFNASTQRMQYLVDKAAIGAFGTGQKREIQELVARATLASHGPGQVHREKWGDVVSAYASVPGIAPGPLSTVGYDADYGKYLQLSAPLGAVPTYEEHLKERLKIAPQSIPLVLEKDYAARVQRESAILKNLVMVYADHRTIREQLQRVRQAYFGWFEGTKITKIERGDVKP